MAEKRKPWVVFLLKKYGKKNIKIELFQAFLWAAKAREPRGAPQYWLNHRYRVRVNGKWFSKPDEKYSFFTIYEVRDMMWRSVKQIMY